MAINLEIRKQLPEGTIIFDNMSYDNSIIGITLDGRAIYDYDLMVFKLMNDEGWSSEDAVDWIDYNTLRSLGYYGNQAPLVVANVWEVYDHE